MGEVAPLRRVAGQLLGRARARRREALRVGRRDAPPFWISGGAGFGLERGPGASGFPFARVWQGTLDVQRPYAGVNLRIDENVAARPSPSAP